MYIAADGGKRILTPSLIARTCEHPHLYSKKKVICDVHAFSSFFASQPNECADHHAVTTGVGTTTGGVPTTLEVAGMTVVTG